MESSAPTPLDEPGLRVGCSLCRIRKASLHLFPRLVCIGARNTNPMHPQFWKIITAEMQNQCCSAPQHEPGEDSYIGLTKGCRSPIPSGREASFQASATRSLKRRGWGLQWLQKLPPSQFASRALSVGKRKSSNVIYAAKPAAYRGH